MDYLVFRLYGPMASWGQVAVGGDRPTGLAPGRSALLGLLAAALGIRREDDEVQSRLAASVTFGVKQIATGTLLRDYHTTQVPSQDKKHCYRTRRDELAVAKEQLNTVLSSRDYRSDGLWIVAVSLLPKTNYKLEALQQALQQPALPLYLGRKSCPLGLPLMPQVVTANNLKTALDTAFPEITRSKKEDGFWLQSQQQPTYYWSGERTALDGQDHPEMLTFQPWDEPLSRSRWQFGQRVQHQWTVTEV